MKEYFIKIIIWLFEKYAFDYWYELQQEKEREEFKLEYNLADDEVEQAMIDRSQQPLRDAYDAGKQDGYNRVCENNNF